MTFPVNQAIETWTATANHDLGYTVVDMATGKEYMYVLYDTGAGTVTGTAGAPVGIYVTADILVASETTVTADLSDSAQSAGVPLGVLRGAPTDGQYGFIEKVQKGRVTTVLADTNNSDQAQYYKWSADSLLTSVLINSTVDDQNLAIAKSMDSDAAAAGYITVAWI
jgi:hypothetical protein